MRIYGQNHLIKGHATTRDSRGDCHRGLKPHATSVIAKQQGGKARGGT